MNEGFSRTVNVGLERARAEGREAILMNADIVMRTPGWLGRCRKTTAAPGEQAGLVGALLLYPNGLIQHAGLYFSRIANMFEHRFRCAPGNLPEALVKTVCPVTGAFQYIRPEVLEQVGVYDPDVPDGLRGRRLRPARLPGGLQLRLRAGASTAIHHESLFRARPDEKLLRWQATSFAYLREKWAGVPIAAARARAVNGRRRGRPLRRPVGGRELLPPDHAARDSRSAATGAGSTRRRRG